MKRWVLLFAAILCFSAAASAQAEYDPRLEVFGGYSFYRFDSPGSAAQETTALTANLNGGSGSVSVNVLKNLGLVGDFGGYEAGSNSNLGSATIVTYLFGPKIFYRTGPFTPFVQFLGGGAHINISGVPSCGAWAVGGGLDVSLNRRFAIRAAEIDYLRTYFEDGSTGHQDNFRVSTGVVFRF